MRTIKTADLNRLVIPGRNPGTTYGSDRPFKDYSCKSKNVEVFFRTLEGELVKRIEESRVVVGCVAWLTSEPILRALRKPEIVCIVVQKEDFLRSDNCGISSREWAKKLRGL